MAQTGYTPILIYASGTTTNVPLAANLTSSSSGAELALNYADGKLYFKNSSGVVTLLASSSATGGTFAAPVVIEGTTTNAALRVTQLGTGNALLVEDSSNPDSTPFVIDANGTTIVGNTTSVAGTITALVQTQGTGTNSANSIQAYSTTNPPTLEFDRSRGALGAQTVVASGDVLGRIFFDGSDGAAFIRGAQIQAEVDGTPGTNDMPGRLVFSTTADGASSPTERMRIDSAGNVGIGGVSSTGVSVYLRKNVTGGTTAYGLAQNVQIQSDVTSTAGLFSSTFTTAASAFTLTNATHFAAIQGTLGAGSAITNQYGFNAQSSLTGATNNYGFYGAIASGTGRYNFYAAGTADNYFAGNVQLATNLTFTGTGNRITGDFSNATVANRVMFQSSTTNGATQVGAIPNGTSAVATFAARNSSDPTNSGVFAVSVSSAEASLNSTINGTGTYLPMTFYTGGSEKLRIQETSFNPASVGNYTTIYSPNLSFGGGFSLTDTNKAGFYLQDTGGTINFFSGQASSDTAASRVKLQINTNGNIISTVGGFIVNAVSGLGYGTGSGGTVTQATSKSTSVTRNSPTGKITMNGAALAANTTVNFQVNNSVIGANDTVIVNVAGGVGDFTAYQAWAWTGGGGYFLIALKNISAGSLSEAVVLNFAIIKGAIA